MISDGEWRRETYIDVIAEICHGFEWIERELFGYHQVVTSAIRHPGSRESWQPKRRFLRENTGRAVKVALPIALPDWPEDVGTGIIPRLPIPTRDAFCEALVPVLRAELLAVREIGVDLIQLDEPHLCVLVDPEVRATFDDPEAEMRKAVEWINAIVDGVEGSHAGGAPLPAELGPAGLGGGWRVRGDPGPHHPPGGRPVDDGI